MTPSDLKAKPKDRQRIVAGILAIVLAIIIFVFSSIPGADLMPGHPDILNVIAHFCLYMVLGVLLTLALNSPRRALWLTGLIAVAIASLYGASDEIHQLFTPGRASDPLDWLTDTAGGLVGALGAIFYLSSRKVKKSRQKDGQQ